ncbi:DUF538 domain-containing protein [Cephalotus follicularis]|uniref:DUF538 domain-containing protein n=1 Tax=Cephalotus follicularis TaxID=3775 RepID=A0A1Q3CM30_CEPFO|nr:DUF538 domain-containing protein [Cephalotus follicularis]
MASLSSISLTFLFLTLLFKTHLSFPLPKLEFNRNRPFLPLNSLTDVHDLLPQYGLPKGLLPNNVKSYSLSSSGDFNIELESPCYVQFDQLVYYDKKIKGQLSYGSVHDVSGIQAKKLFLWVSVTGIVAEKDSGTIDFYVGALSESLPAKQFDDIPVCKSKSCYHETKLESI